MRILAKSAVALVKGARATSQDRRIHASIARVASARVSVVLLPCQARHADVTGASDPEDLIFSQLENLLWPGYKHLNVGNFPR